MQYRHALARLLLATMALLGAPSAAAGADLLRAPYLAFPVGDWKVPVTGTSLGVGPVGVAAGDLDGDGREDLAVVCRDAFGINGGRSVSILLSDSNPSLPALASPALYATTYGPTGVAIGDLNGDGRLDVATADAGDDSICVFINKGAGVLAPKKTLGVGAHPYQIVIADLNGDARNDIVAGVGSGARVYLATGAPGSFAAPIAVSVSGSEAAVAVGKVDGDTVPDLVVATTFPDALVILHGNGDGTFSNAGAPALLAPPTGLALADMTGDGKLDAVVCEYNRLTIYANSATPFTTVTDDRALSGSALDLVCRDLDGNGLPDVALAMQVGVGSFKTCALYYGNGAGGFASDTSFDLGPFLEAISAGDLNGDGRPDIAACGAGQTSELKFQRAVNVAFQTTFGTFGIGSAYRNPVFDVDACHAVVADMNGDAKDDLVIAGEHGATSQASVTIRPGMGDGSWDPGFEFIVSGDRLPHVVTGDFNRDGKVDVVVGEVPSGGAPSTTTYLGNGDGTIAPLLSSIMPTHDALAAVDLDRDGKLDLFMIDTMGEDPCLFRGLGDGTFTFSSQVGYPYGKPHAAAVGDLNRDGRPDIVFSLGQDVIGEPSTDYGTYIILGDGTGNLALPVRFTPIVYEDLKIVDVDDDGIPDVLGDGPAVYRGLGNGVMVLQPNAFGAALRSPSVMAADLNRDGHVDVVSDNADPTTGPAFLDPRLDVWLGNVTLGYGTHTAYGAGRRSFELLGVDANRDGRTDVINLNRDPGFTPPSTEPWLLTLLGNGPPTFNFPATVVNSPTPSPPYAMTTADFTQDGTPDAVVVRNETGGDFATLLVGNGTGGFTSTISNPVPASPSALAAGDLNRDGIPDVAIACSDGDAVMIELGTPYDTLTVPTPVVMGLGYEFSDIAIGDFNRDGKPDLAAASAATYTILYIPGNGDGTFGTPVPISTGSNGPTAIAVGDVDGNGTPDIVAALGTGLSPSTIGVLRGNGDGTFQTIRPYACGASPDAITLGDFNRDGILDVAVTRIGASGSQYVAVLLGATGGGYLSPATYPINGNAFDIAAGDIDGDGMLDLMAPSGYFTSTIAFLQGQSGGHFASNVDHFIGSSPTALAVEDCNNDGRPDIVGGMSGGANVAVLLSAPSTISAVALQPAAEAPAAPRLAIRPNPAAGHATVTFRAPASARASVDLFDVRGRRVARLYDGPVANEVEIPWTGRGENGRAAAGVYFAKLTTAEGAVVTRKLVWLR